MTPFKAILAIKPLRVTRPLTEDHKRAEGYYPAAGLVEAMDVAMLLGQPLLLTGDPGTGKTRAAYWLATELEATPLLRYDVKSTSTGTDLLYHFDEVARFRDSTRHEKKSLVRYLRFNALGDAILRATGGQSALYTIDGEKLEGVALAHHRELLEDAFGERAPRDGQAHSSLLVPEDTAFATASPEHRVVLIDELDKAPRDTPNDLLAEIEEMSFKIPELGLWVRAADPGFRPIVIITSNSEKSLPDPFLRRCAYFDIALPRRYDKKIDGNWPGQGTLEQIVNGRIDALSGGGPLVEQALDLFQRIRKSDSGIRKTPGTAELLAWLDVLVAQYKFGPKDDLSLKPDTVAATLAAMLKTKDDIDAAQRVVADWASSAGGKSRS
jgi:MoxR-like ATPase